MVRPRRGQSGLSSLSVSTCDPQLVRTRIKIATTTARRSAVRRWQRSLSHLPWTALARLASARLRNSSRSTLHLSVVKRHRTMVKRPKTTLHPELLKTQTRLHPRRHHRHHPRRRHRRPVCQDSHHPRRHHRHLHLRGYSALYPPVRLVRHHHHLPLLLLGAVTRL